ncbi:MAG: hypothetical protein Q9208_003019 [Pyrenodesmia sp. 3 TL-2023]
MAQATIQYAAPIVVLLYYVGALTSSACILQKGRKYKSKRQHQAIIAVLGFVLATYLFQSGLLAIDSFSPIPRASSVAANVHAISSSLLWFLFVIVLHRTRRPVSYPHVGSWLITLVFDIVLFSFFASQHTVTTAVSVLLLVTWACRILALLALLAIQAAARFNLRRSRSDEESTSLLRRKIVASFRRNSDLQPGGGYGSISVNNDPNASSTDSEGSESENSSDDEAKKRQKAVSERLKEDGNWFTYLRGFSIFVPLIWPSRQPVLYLNMVGCGLCLLGRRALNIMVPYQLGVIITILTNGTGSFYRAIALYILLLWADSSYGFWLLQNFLWQPLERYSNIAISTAAFNQIMELSSDFHDSKQSGELYQAIEHGSSINDLLDMLVFQLGPSAIDAVVGIGYLHLLFGPYMALLALATVCAYCVAVTHFNGKQSGIRREYLALATKRNRLMYDTVGSWQTVSYFNRISYEEERYGKVVANCITAQVRYWALGYLYAACSDITMDFGFWGILLLAGYKVMHGSNTVGQFVQLLTYWSIFTRPIHVITQSHRRILDKLVDAEQLLRLLQHERKVKDGSQKFLLTAGAVEFKDVHFSYDGFKKVIKALNFTAKPGQKIALVGETGGGKSTLLKLLFRFYDVTAGSVSIDGQDVRDVTLESLRDRIGVVPQNPSMFNDTVMNNVRYSKLDATDEEVMEACKAAAVHEKVLSFTDGYASKVGEKGVKLSGGELQRLAIARAILKDPKIILLDEATSSVDTETESRIQAALHKLTQGRTTFTVAHRLSTVIDADFILVIKNGEIIEQGPPQELLAAKGKYYDLWCKQVGIITSLTKESDETKGPVNNESDHATAQPMGTTATDAKDDESAPKDTKQARSGSREQKKVWRPDAPEFVPRHLRGSTTSKDKAATSRLPSYGKRQRARENTPKVAATTGAADKTAEDAKQKYEMIANESDGNHKRTRFSRNRRRNMSKSEPTGSGVSAGEVVVDTNAAPEGSSAGQATERRRVSAPSIPPPSAESKQPGQGRRSRRKQWKVQQQGSSQSHSAPQSTRTSATWASEPGVPETSAPKENIPPQFESTNLDKFEEGSRKKETVYMRHGTNHLSLVDKPDISEPGKPSVATSGQNGGGKGEGENLGQGSVRFAPDA